MLTLVVSVYFITIFVTYNFASLYFNFISVLEFSSRFVCLNRNSHTNSFCPSQKPVIRTLFPVSILMFLCISSRLFLLCRGGIRLRCEYHKFPYGKYNLLSNITIINDSSIVWLYLVVNWLSSKEFGLRSIKRSLFTLGRSFISIIIGEIILRINKKRFEVIKIFHDVIPKKCKTTNTFHNYFMYL